jgi:hypothetical protein
MPIEQNDPAAGRKFWAAIIRNVGTLGWSDLAALSSAIDGRRNFDSLPPDIRRALARAEAEITR